MTFAEAVEKAGFVLATQIFKEICGVDFESKLSFAEWVIAIKAVQARDKHNLTSLRLARQYLRPLAKTYSDWKIVLLETDYREEHGEDGERNKIIDELFSATCSIKECQDFMALLQSESRSTYCRFELALPEKGVRLAKIFADWDWLISTFFRNKEVRRLCLIGMEKEATSFKDWLRIYNHTSKDEVLKQTAFQKLVELAK